MSYGRIIMAAAAAYFAGQGYFVNTNYNMPGTDNLVVDMCAVMPILRQLKPRIKRGCAPSGILAHIIDSGWVSVKEIIDVTGYKPSFVGETLEDAARAGWVEIDISGDEAKVKIKDYQIPARECVLVFLGAEELEKKLEIFLSLQGAVNSGYFVFPYLLDGPSTELIVQTGAGIMHYHEKHGIFQEIVPAESMDIEDRRRFAMITEKILYDDIWLRMGEII